MLTLTRLRSIFVSVPRRALASSSTPPTVEIPRLTYSEVKRELDRRGDHTLLLDVREKGELAEDGRIPQARHVPLGEVEGAFKLDAATFKKTYGFDKPSNSNGVNLIVHCKAGLRAMKAAVVLTQAGYSNVSVYNGILDWLSNGGEIVKK